MNLLVPSLPPGIPPPPLPPPFPPFRSCPPLPSFPWMKGGSRTDKRRAFQTQTMKPTMQYQGSFATSPWWQAWPATSPATTSAASSATATFSSARAAWHAVLLSRLLLVRVHFDVAWSCVGQDEAVRGWSSGMGCFGESAGETEVLETTSRNHSKINCVG